MSTAAAVIVPASQQLQDVSNVKWLTSILINYLNLALLAITGLRPEAYPTNTNATLVAGPVQTLPTGAIRLLSAICNMGVGGATPGAAILTIEKDDFSKRNPNWTTATAANTVTAVIRDKETPKTFYVYPPQPSPAPGQQILLTVLIPPTTITATTDTFPYDDSYLPACIDYVVYRALAEETTMQNSQVKAKLYYQTFLQALGIQTIIDNKLAIGEVKTSTGEVKTQ